MGWLAFRSKKIDRLLEGKPVILIHGGKIDHAALAKVQMTQADLQAALRANGHVSAEEIQIAILETTGRVSVIARDRKLDA